MSVEGKGWVWLGGDERGWVWLGGDECGGLGEVEESELRGMGWEVGEGANVGRDRWK